MTVYFKLADHVSFTKIDDEAVLLDLNSGSYFGLNHVGIKLIEAFNDGLDKPGAVTSIAEHYQVSVSQVGQDVDALITDMLQKQLLQQI